MVTGKPAFAGATISDVIAGVLEREPDWAALPEEAPESVRRVLRWALAKDPRQRLRDIADARLALETAAAVLPGAETRRSLRRQGITRAAWVAAVIVSAGVGAAISRAVRPAVSVAAGVSSQFAIPVGQTEVLPRNVAISPNGRFVAYLAGPPGNQKTYLRRIGEPESHVIAELPMQAPQPFFSPDSQWLAFFDAGKLKKLAVDGGSSIILAEAPTPRGGTWGTDGSIVFAPISRGGLMWIPPSGGPPRVLTTPNGDRGETSHRFPVFLPQSSTVLFVVAGTSDANALQAVSLDDPRVRLIMRGVVTNPRYLPTGHLAYLINEKLVAAPFDLQTLQLAGASITLAERVNSFAFSDEGTLVYSESTLADTRVSTPVWTARDGAVTPLPLPPAIYDHPRISPDGRSIVVQKAMLPAGSGDLWVYDTTRETLTKFTLTARNNWPVWTPDGKRLIYGSNRPDTQWDIVEKPADGSGPERMLLARPLTQIPRAVSPTGDTVVFEETYADRANTLWQMPLREIGEPHPLFDRAGEMMPTFSPTDAGSRTCPLNRHATRCTSGLAPTRGAHGRFPTTAASNPFGRRAAVNCSTEPTTR
jgi:serine/threonine-protein kinase